MQEVAEGAMPKQDELSHLEKEFRRHKESGGWEKYALSCEETLAEPPWRPMARRLALARAASGKGIVDEHAGQIFDSDLWQLELDLHARRQKARYEALGDMIALGTSRALERLYPPTGRLRKEFIQYVLSDGAQPATELARSRLTANLYALVRRTGLTYRKFAEQMGQGDHKAVIAHCKGEREPEDFMVTRYATVFSRLLNLEIRPEALRTDDFTVETPPKTPTST
jgi:hypothetical protein